MGSVNVSQDVDYEGYASEYAYATIRWDKGPTVTVTIDSMNVVTWRIRGRNPDTKEYLVATGGVRTGTFEAEDGKDYVFQIYSQAYAKYSDGQIFTVNFGDDSGGSGSGGSDWGDDDSGSDWEDDGGSSSSGGSDTCSVYASGSGHSLYATVRWSSGPKVTVEVSSTTSWRLVTRGNSNDVHLSSSYATDSYTNTFNATDGGEYIFQVYDAVDGYYTNNSFDTSGFTVNFTNGGSGGDDWDDDWDDSGGSGGEANNTLKTYTVTALGVEAEVTYASGPEVTIRIKSWSGYNSIPYWRIKGRASQGDSNTYLSQTNASSASFNSYDGYNYGGKEYTFQVCRNGAWGNDSNEDSVFLVDFSLYGEGGGGEESPYPVTLYVNQGEGTKVKVVRTWSNYSTNYYVNAGGVMYENGVMYDDQIWYDGDFFEISVEAEDGYELDYYDLDEHIVPFNANNLKWHSEGEYISDKRYKLAFDSDVTITTTATPSATARIYSNSGWNKYTLYIYSDSNWNKYTPYIYKDSSWNKYS